MASKNKKFKFLKPAKNRNYVQEAIGATVAPGAFVGTAMLNNIDVVQAEYTKNPKLKTIVSLGMVGLHVATRIFVENEHIREAATGVGVYGTMMGVKELLPTQAASAGLSGLGEATGQVIDATPKIDWAAASAKAGMSGYNEDPNTEEYNNFG